MHEAYQVDVNWLFTGRTIQASSGGASPISPAEFDEELVRMVTASMIHIFRAEGLEIPVEDIAVEMVRIYLEAAAYSDEEQRDAFAAGCAAAFVRGVEREIAKMRRDPPPSTQLEIGAQRAEEAAVERRHGAEERRGRKRAVR
jgi:hypothetical protein